VLTDTILPEGLTVPNLTRPDAAARTLATVCAATAILMLDVAVLNTALPRVARDLHAGFSGLQWVIDAYAVFLAATVLTAGSIADRVGRKRSFLAGVAVFIACSLACALAGSIGVLDVFRALQGIGGAIMFTTSLALLGEAFPGAKDRAAALGVYGASIGASFAIGPLAGGALTSAFSWRAVFLVNIPIGLGCIWGALGIRESKNPDARRPDWTGQAVLATGLFLLVLGLLRGNTDGWATPHIVAELAAAIFLLGAFLVIEARVKEPMLPLSLFKSCSFTGAQVAAFAISGSMFAIFLYVGLYLQDVLRLSPVQAGLVYLPGTVLMFIVSGATASLHGRVSTRSLVIAGLVLVSLGLLACLPAGSSSSWQAIEPGLLIASAGVGMFNPALSGLVLSEAPEGQSALAAGINDTFRQIGLALGIAALGAFISSRSGSGYVSGFHTALIVSSVVAAAGAAAAYLLLHARPSQDHQAVGVTFPEHDAVIRH
jgi:EmrB/QacA subfamily drug resistance transporter